MRTLVDIPEEKIVRLDHIARRQKVSRAEIIRRAVDTVLETDRAEEDAHFKAAFGAWRHRNIDGLDFIRRLRAEWEDDAEPIDLNEFR